MGECKIEKIWYEVTPREMIATIFEYNFINDWEPIIEIDTNSIKYDLMVQRYDIIHLCHYPKVDTVAFENLKLEVKEEVLDRGVDLVVVFMVVPAIDACGHPPTYGQVVEFLQQFQGICDNVQWCVSISTCSSCIEL